MSDFAPTDRLVEVRLAERRRANRPATIQQELDVAIYDLTEENRFRISPRGDGAVPPGPYVLSIGMEERMLVMTVAPAEVERGAEAREAHWGEREGEQEGVHELRLSLSPLRGVIKDYFAICESYFDAVKRLPPSRIEAIDMGRRGVHDEGARILAERLDGKIDADHDTHRRLFTVICALQFRG